MQVDYLVEVLEPSPVDVGVHIRELLRDIRDITSREKEKIEKKAPS